MKVLSRDFTNKEKMLLLVFAMLILGLLYYYLVDQPVRKEIARCETEKVQLQKVLTQVEDKLHTLESMKEELENIEASGDVSEMKSYNASKEEIRILNDALSHTSKYSITFSSVTRDGDQIRRNFSLEFTAVDYETMALILSDLAESPLRCRIANIQCSRRSRYALYNYDDAVYNIKATATFYETMVGGTPDAGLPASKTK